MIAEVQELVDRYEDGTYTRNDLLNRILALSLAFPVDGIVDSLPERWKDEFLSWARRQFDNTIPLEEFVVISQGAPCSDDLEPIRRIRDWFRSRR